MPSEEIIFYPNPTKNIVYIGTKNIIHKIFIYDVNGKFISERSVSNNQVNIQDLRNGIYFIKPNNSNINSFKIIKN